MRNSDVLFARDDWRIGRIDAEGTRVTERYRPKFWFWLKLSLFCFVLMSLLGGLVVFLEGELIPAAVIVPLGALLLGTVPALVYYGLKLAAYLQHRKYGDSHFVFNPPAKLGQRLEGAIETTIPMSKRPADGFSVTVERVSHSKYTNNEGKTCRRSSTQWEDSQSVDPVIKASENKLIIPVSFDLPLDQSPSRGAVSWGGSGVGSEWRLIVHAKAPGWDYRVRFLFPVVKES